MYKLETLWVELGKKLYANENDLQPRVLFPARKFFATGIIAKTRTGKTSIAKTLLVDLYRRGNRKIIIFDPYSDYWKLGEYNNHRQAEIQKISYLKLFKNFAFRISQFSLNDWLSLGIAELGAKICNDIGKKIKLHYDDPDKFLEILSKLPINEESIENFNNEYASQGLYFNSRLPESTITALNSRLHFLKYIFKYPNDNKKEIDIKDLIKFIDNYVIIFDLQLQKGEDVFKGRAYVGIILRMLKPYLEKYNPVICIDEADLFAPNVKEFWEYPSSLKELIEYGIKLQRAHIGLILITQHEKLLHPTLVRSFHNKIIGIVDKDSQFYDYTHNLFWDYDKGIRQFVYIDENNRAFPFNARICPCMP
ncbi:MAG: DUF87 domain-containing protein [Nanoarchaeota archaeon]